MGRYRNVTGTSPKEAPNPVLGMLTWDEVIEREALLMEHASGKRVYIPRDGQEQKIKQGYAYVDPQPQLPNGVIPEVPTQDSASVEPPPEPVRKTKAKAKK